MKPRKGAAGRPLKPVPTDTKGMGLKPPPNYGKKLAAAAAGPGAPLKQVAHEMLPSRSSLATITKGDPVQRSMNNYAKQTPADMSGAGSLGQMGILIKG